MLPPAGAGLTLTTARRILVAAAAAMLCTPVARARGVTIIPHRRESSGNGQFLHDRRADSLPPVTVADVVGMTRIQSTTQPNDHAVVFAPDGKVAAAVVWRGDLTHDANIYTIIAFDLHDLDHVTSSSVLEVPFTGDPVDTSVGVLQPLGETPIAQVRILPDDRTIVFLGALHGEPRQVYAVDRVSRELRQLTHHSTAIRSYGVSNDGLLRLFSAVAPDDTQATRQRDRTGVSLLPLFESMTALEAVIGIIRQPDVALTRQYFLVRTDGDAPVLVYDTKECAGATHTDSAWLVAPVHPATGWTFGSVADDWAPKTLSVDPTGRYAIIWPYMTATERVYPERYAGVDSLERKDQDMAAPYGLVDLVTGGVRRLIDAPRLPYQAGGNLEPVWASDGHAVVVGSLLPLDARDPAVNAVRARAQQGPVEVDVPSGRVRRVALPAGPDGHVWHPIRWDAGGLTVQEEVSPYTLGKTIAYLPRTGHTWGTLSVRGTTHGFNPNYEVSTTGRLVAGVVDSLTVAPEIALYDLVSRRTVRVTDLNPTLRHRAYGDIRKIHWRGPHDTASFGYLIKPLGYKQGHRYPLLVLQKDEGSHPEDDSFLIDGQAQLSGYAIQTLAADGFMVLFTPDAPSERSAPRAAMGQIAQAHVESGISFLNAQGLIDTTRVAIAGWSWSGYYTQYILTHSGFPFAAGVEIDGEGLFDYTSDTREPLPVANLHVPLLIEIHNPGKLYANWPWLLRLQLLKKPFDVYYYPRAPHNITQPAARWTSLTSNIDWYRFWLQDYKDPDPAKREQYARWEALRAVSANAQAPQAR